MEYDKTVWQNNVTPIDEINLNHIEDGIEDAAEAISDLEGLIVTITPSSTQSELRAAYEKAMVVKYISATPGVAPQYMYRYFDPTNPLSNNSKVFFYKIVPTPASSATYIEGTRLDIIYSTGTFSQSFASYNIPRYPHLYQHSIKFNATFTYNSTEYYVHLIVTKLSNSSTPYTSASWTTSSGELFIGYGLVRDRTNDQIYDIVRAYGASDNGISVQFTKTYTGILGKDFVTIPVAPTYLTEDIVAQIL